MSPARSIGMALLFVVALTLGAGCKGGGKADPQVQAQEQQLKDIQEMYFLFVKEHNKPPTQMPDLANKQFEGIYPATVQALEKGKYEVIWGINSKDGGTLLAYEKAAAATEGLGVMADGSVRKVTADQVKAAKK